MLTQKLDPFDPVLAFTLGWVRALAARVDHLHVLCLEIQPLTEPLPGNVTAWSMGKEHGAGRAQELGAFYKVLSRISGDADVVFCHMIPRFAVLATPFAMLYGKPLILWYVHRQISLELRLAMAFSHYVATAVPDSFPLPTSKLRPLGHGIDAEFFASDANPVSCDEPLIVHVARLMPIKHQDILLRAFAALPDRITARIALVGEVPRGQDASYRDQLRALADDLGIASHVTFTGGLNPQAVRDLYRQASIAVNLSPPGLFDKAALESMLCGVPTVVANPAFDPVLGDYMPQLRISSSDDVSGLTERLRALLAPDFLSSAASQTMTQTVRERVRAAHSLDGLMDRLVALMVSAASTS